MLSDLPQPILNDVLNYVCFKREYQPLNENLQIKELLFCLRQSYLRRVNPKAITDLKTAFKIYKGMVWDKKLCCLFPVNQRYVRYQCKFSLAKINGRYDFLDVDTVTELKIVDDVDLIIKPYLENEQQVKFYAYVDCQPKAQVLYFDGCDAKKFSVDLSDSKELIDRLEETAALFYRCLCFSQYPPRTTCLVKCVNCEFNGVC
jgi:hypothetical protein